MQFQQGRSLPETGLVDCAANKLVQCFGMRDNLIPVAPVGTLIVSEALAM